MPRASASGVGPISEGERSCPGPAGAGPGAGLGAVGSTSMCSAWVSLMQNGWGEGPAAGVWNVTEDRRLWRCVGLMASGLSSSGWASPRASRDRPRSPGSKSVSGMHTCRAESSPSSDGLASCPVKPPGGGPLKAPASVPVNGRDRLPDSGPVPPAPVPRDGPRDGPGPDASFGSPVGAAGAVRRSQGVRASGPELGAGGGGGPAAPAGSHSAPAAHLTSSSRLTHPPPAPSGRGPTSHRLPASHRTPTSRARRSSSSSAPAAPPRRTGSVGGTAVGSPPAPPPAPAPPQSRAAGAQARTVGATAEADGSGAEAGGLGRAAAAGASATAAVAVAGAGISCTREPRPPRRSLPAPRRAPHPPRASGRK